MEVPMNQREQLESDDRGGAPRFIVTRTIEPWSGVTVQLRVPRSTAEQWSPGHRCNEPLLNATADGHAYRLVVEAMRAGRLGVGRWVATFPGGDRMELAPLESVEG